MITDYIKENNGNEYVAGIDYVHPEYEYFAPLWQKARDVIAGQDEMKRIVKREKYLPRLGGHTSTPDGNADYNAFVGYAMLYNATGRTVEAYRGLLNRKLPVVSIPETVKGLINDFTIKSESIYTFIEQVETEIVTTNRVGIFIDHPFTANKAMTKAEVTTKNIAPYATLYTAECITNWEETRTNNKIVTSLVVLKETEYRRINSFAPTEMVTYRVLELDGQGKYRQVILEPVATGNYAGQQLQYSIKQIIYPKRNGEYLTEIPFYPVTAQGITWELSKSVIHDLVNINIAHYRDTAFYEKAIAWTASPTAVFSGLPEDTQDVAIGSSQALTIAMGGTAKYLEYEGKGLQDIAEGLTKKEELMAILGAKILANTANGIESGEAAMIHRAGEQGILADIATTVGGAIEKALRYIIHWGGTKVSDDNIKVDITKDYTPTIIDANTIVALSAELQKGHISDVTYFEALKRGEIMEPTRTVDEEKSLIKKYRKGTVMGKDATVTYLDKDKFDDILGREEDLIDMKKSTPATGTGTGTGTTEGAVDTGAVKGIDNKAK